MASMGDRIFQKRKEYDMTMEELGQLLGVNKTAVNKWEKGIVKNIKQSTIKQMADIFHCSPAWLMGFDPEPLGTVPEFEPDHVELIDLYSKLDSEQKRTILNMLRSFVGKD